MNEGALIIIVALVSVSGCLGAGYGSTDSGPDNSTYWESTPTETIPTQSPAHGQENYREPEYPNVSRHDGINRSAVEREVFDEINFKRMSNGLEPLVEDDRLGNIARNYSMYMAGDDFFAHTDPRGLGFGDRMKSHNYSCDGGREILARTGYKIPVENDRGDVYNITSQERLGDDFVNIWMKSYPHREAILYTDVTTLGVGVHVRADGVAYATAYLCG